MDPAALYGAILFNAVAYYPVFERIGTGEAKDVADFCADRREHVRRALDG